MSTVFVTQEVPTANYTDAGRFGDVVFLCASEMSTTPKSLHNARLIASIRAKLKDFDPNCDHIVPSGSPAIASVVFALVGKKTSRFSILKWNSRDRVYTPIDIDLEGIVNAI